MLLTLSLVYRGRFRADYEALETRLSTLPDQLSHDIMVGPPLEHCVVCG